jgi:cell wall-associated NlpC family hydrolase
MRYILRTIGTDSDAPWVHEEYLSRYPAVDRADLQPGDIVIYPGWATMYAGNGQLLNSNEMEGVVTHTPMDVAGEPLGIVRPY